MKNKILITTIFSIIILTLMIVPVSAFFTRSHIFWTLNGFEEVDSSVTQLCENKKDIVIDGMVSADVPVIFYFSDKVYSYISTHTKFSGYDICMRHAGQDVDLQCFCLGVGLHNVQDHFSHTSGGLTPKYIEKFYSSNLGGHMTIELEFENNHMDMMERTEVVSSGMLDYYDSIILNNLFEEEGGNIKYFNVLKDISGLDMRNTANIFANSYKGTNFYDTVYNEKLSLPYWFWGVSIGLIILGLGASLLFLRYGVTNWRWLLILIYISLAILGALILIGLFTGNSWAWIQFSVDLVPISITSADMTYYNDIVQHATNDFLRTGELRFEDNSGLSYYSSEGRYVEGALSIAEKKFQYYILPTIIAIFAAINIFLIYKTFKIKEQK